MSETSIQRLSPFPGMDPYLEAPDVWSDFHDRFAGVMSSLLNAALPDHYYAQLRSRPELGIVMQEGIMRHIIPDVTVVRWEMREARAPYATAGAPVLELPRRQSSPGVDFRLIHDEYQHRFVEIRDSVRDHKLVTLIEIVSPSNKYPGADRHAYESKQQAILNSDTSLIEIDLLRSGRRLLPYPQLFLEIDRLAPDYLVMLNRSSVREGHWVDFTGYPVKLRDPLPCIPVPLVAPDPDVLLDLQVAFNRVYIEGPYTRMIDYRADPEPPLEDEDAAWADQLLRAAGLRESQPAEG